MGLIIKGKWVNQPNDIKSKEGKFVRQESFFRDFIDSKKFSPEINRYHLYVSYACPWAHRAIIFRKLKGLEKIIGLTSVDAYMGDSGWKLNNDIINNKKYLHEIYTLANPNYTGRVTVPVLWDKKEQTIVNNESSEIIRILNSDFDKITGNKNNYYPEELKSEIDKINEFVYSMINNAVYKAGFATDQDVYHNEVTKLFDALDIIEKLLSKQRYLVGNTLTEADWRIFTTLIRFDSVYVGHFKCNIRRISDYHHISNYIKELYQIEGISETVNIEHIKKHYYTSHLNINPNSIIPSGPEIDYEAKHNRNTLIN